MKKFLHYLRIGTVLMGAATLPAVVVAAEEPGSPLFDVAEVTVGEGKTLTVRAEGNAPDHPYVQSVRWNGKPWSKNWIAHADLIGGGELVFEMGAKPSRFGTAKADRPPSFGATPG